MSRAPRKRSALEACILLLKKSLLERGIIHPHIEIPADDLRQLHQPTEEELPLTSPDMDKLFNQPNDPTELHLYGHLKPDIIPTGHAGAKYEAWRLTILYSW
ncbi:MAG TPA: hypothetical protein VI874_03090 [Candidatus Norongarragalinales archaeon]|nr:hypothetical protein [Candidatus Norongarragalinales archaeon]